MVDENQARIGGSEKFRVSKYDSNGGLSETAVFWPKVRDNDRDLVLALVPTINVLISDGEWLERLC